MGRQPPTDRGRSHAASRHAVASGHHDGAARAARHWQLKLLLALLALSLGAEAAAQETFKCKDAAGRITYSSEDCGKMGLDPAGGVKDRVITQTTRKPQPLPALPPDLENPRAAPKGSARGEEKCSTIMTPFGYRTHCAKPAGALD